MREIRFRAWDKENKFYEYDVQNATVASEHEYEDFDSYFPFKFDGRIVDNHILEQYTGVKDKDGTDIFEGDIVDASVDSGFDYYSHEKALIVFSEVQAGFAIQSNDSLVLRLWNDDAMDHEYEVIGNIHENPELLEEGND